MTARAALTARMRVRPALSRAAAVAIGTTGLLAGCAAMPPEREAAAAGPEFLLVRHAEKAADDPRDPRLTTEGDARARRLAAELRDATLVAVYSTDTSRTRATAMPSAQVHGLAVTPYDARATVPFASELRKRHRRGLVLVVGHSNTVPALAAALCGCSVAPMAEHEYGLRYRLRTTPTDVSARLEAEAW